MYTIYCTICENDGLGYKPSLKQCTKCFNKKCVLYQNARYARDPCFKLAKVQRNRIRKAIVSQNAKTNCKTLELLGCTTDELRSHLESQFSPEMTWANYGKFWVVDHVIPIASFNLNDQTQQELAFRYKNLQPLFWRDNLLKGAKII